MTDTRFEDELSPAVRKLRRALRNIRWHVKGLLGRPRTILVEMNWRLGDEIMAVPIYTALKTQYPDDHLEVYTHYPELIETVAAIDKVNPTHCRPDRYVFLRDASRTRPRIEHYAALAEIPVPSENPRLALDPESAAMPAGLFRAERPIVALAPGASWETKRWPRSEWRLLAERLLGQGYTVVTLGLEGEGVGIGIDLTGQTPLFQAAHILHHCDAAITCDSGLMHLALAVHTPTVALFGPTDPTILIRDEPRLTVVSNQRECQGCWNGSQTMIEPGICPREIGCCMETISQDRVIQALAAILPAS